MTAKKMSDYEEEFGYVYTDTSELRDDCYNCLCEDLSEEERAFMRCLSIEEYERILNVNTEHVDEDKYYLNYAKVLETIIEEAAREKEDNDE